MKQRITCDQLRELTDEQKERLREWWKPTMGDIIESRGEAEAVIGFFEQDGERWIQYAGGYASGNHLPLLSIGQMIELLANNKKRHTLEFTSSKCELREVLTNFEDRVSIVNCVGAAAEPADALFQAVKVVL